MRYAPLAIQLATAAVMVMPLGGCIISDHIYPMPSTGVGGYTEPYTGPVGPVYDMNGSTLADASHAVQRYLSSHYPAAELVRVHALMVGTNAKIDQTSSWEFTYRVQVATPVPQILPVLPATVSATASYQAQAIVPTTFRYRLLKFTYTGRNQLLAPVEQDDLGDSLASVDFSRTILLDEAIATALDIGMGVGAPGMELTLRPTLNGGAVYELDSAVATRAASPMKTQSMVTYDEWEYSYTKTTTKASPTPAPSYYYDEPNYSSKPRYASPKPTPTPAPTVRYTRGKYVLDAYTGAILERPTNL